MVVGVNPPIVRGDARMDIQPPKLNPHAKRQARAEQPIAETTVNQPDRIVPGIMPIIGNPHIVENHSSDRNGFLKDGLDRQKISDQIYAFEVRSEALSCHFRHEFRSN